MTKSSTPVLPTADSKIVHWLLEADQPAVQYATLVGLLDRPESDPQVRSSRSRIARSGWAHDQLRRQRPEGYWERREPRTVKEYVDFLYYPKFLGTNWRALVLADLGLDSSDPRIEKLAEQVFDYKLRLGSPFNFFHEEACASANTARMLTRFGYADDPRVRRLYDWLVEDQREDGGWNCSQGTPGTLDVWEPLAAFASLPKSKRPPKMDRAIARGAEFYLKRGLLREGRPYAPWRRLHYPNHYFYDVLVGLDLVTQLGFAGDRRLRPALRILMEKRRRDGSWVIERSHPDLGPAKAGQSSPERTTPLVIETPGQPSKWITLKALSVWKRIEDAT